MYCDLRAYANGKPSILTHLDLLCVSLLHGMHVRRSQNAKSGSRCFVRQRVADVRHEHADGQYVFMACGYTGERIHGNGTYSRAYSLIIFAATYRKLYTTL